MILVIKRFNSYIWSYLLEIVSIVSHSITRPTDPRPQHTGTLTRLQARISRRTRACGCPCAGAEAPTHVRPQPRAQLPVPPRIRTRAVQLRARPPFGLSFVGGSVLPFSRRRKGVDVPVRPTVRPPAARPLSGAVGSRAPVIVRGARGFVLPAGVDLPVTRDG